MPKVKQLTKYEEKETNNWIEQQGRITKRSSLIPYDYFTYASLINQEKGATNLWYLRALSKAKTISPHKINLIENMESKMKQRDNSRSNFGKQYIEYWKEREDARSRERIENLKRGTREAIVQDAMRLMTAASSEVAGPSRQAVFENENEAGESEDSDDVKDDTKKLDETIYICKNAGLALGELNIIDLTDHNVENLLRQSLNPKFLDKVKQLTTAQWEEEPYCKKLLDALCLPGADVRDLCQILRTPVIDAKDFRPAKHYDLRTVENLAGAWIDLMCSPSNTIAAEIGERTSALDGVILVVKNLFRPFNDIVHTKWIEIEDESSYRHKWDGIVSAVDDKATVMLIEFAGGFRNADPNKLSKDTIKIYRNAARLLNNKNSNQSNPPSIYVVISHRFKIYFEALTLLTDRAYIRTRVATMNVPFSPNGLKLAMEQLPSVFAWRDMFIASVKNNVPNSTSNLETVPVPSTP